MKHLLHVFITREKSTWRSFLLCYTIKPPLNYIIFTFIYIKFLFFDFEIQLYKESKGVRVGLKAPRVGVMCDWLALYCWPNDWPMNKYFWNQTIVWQGVPINHSSKHLFISCYSKLWTWHTKGSWNVSMCNVQIQDIKKLPESDP